MRVNFRRQGDIPLYPGTGISRTSTGDRGAAVPGGTGWVWGHLNLP